MYLLNSYLIVMCHVILSIVLFSHLDYYFNKRLLVIKNH